jgi:hypothetical protein
MSKTNPTGGSWARAYIYELAEGNVVEFSPVGKSMEPLIFSGQRVRVEPVRGKIEQGDIVLCRVNNKIYLHAVKAVNTSGACLIGNNKGGLNGWTTRDQVFGRVAWIEPLPT